MKRLFLIVWTAGMLLSTAALSQLTWQVTSGPEGGNIRALAVNSQGSLFAGTMGGGLFRSQDNGTTWQSLNQNLPNPFSNLFVNCIAISQAGDIFAGTGNPWMSIGQILRSTDDGNTWMESVDGPGGSIAAIVVNNNSGHVFAASGGKILRSIDNGVSWVLSSTLNAQITSLVVDLFGNLVAGSWLRGVFISMDNGESWGWFGTNSPNQVTSLAVGS